MSHALTQLKRNTTRRDATQRNTTPVHNAGMSQPFVALLATSVAITRLAPPAAPPAQRIRYYWRLRSSVQTQLNAARRPERCKQLAQAPGEVEGCLFSLLQNAYKEILESESRI